MKSISLEKYHKIKELVAQGVSIRGIAKVVSVDRKTVEKYNGLAEHPDERPKEPAPPFPRVTGYIKHSRCNGCGAMVQLPCFACYLKGRRPESRTIAEISQKTRF